MPSVKVPLLTTEPPVLFVKVDPYSSPAEPTVTEAEFVKVTPPVM